MFSILLFSGQEESIFLEENQSTSQFADGGTVINGRFFFNSKQQIQKSKPVDTYYRTYTYYDLDIYAMGKRNGLWKGSRMFVTK
jgi:hypothetical protein